MIPIITYHAVGDEASPVFTPPGVFEAQVKALAEAEYQSVSLASALRALKNGGALPEKAVVITFDDGYESVYRLAWPRLQQHGLGATVFLISDYCGRDNRWPGQPEGIPTKPLMSWAQAREMAAQGCEFGAHTRTHPPLTTLPLEQAEAEIVGSQARIQQETEQAARTFCYPYGATDAAVRAVVTRHFDGAASTILGVAGAASDPYRLERIDSYYLTPGWIQGMGGLAFREYLRLRRGLRAVKRVVKRDWA